MIHTSDKWISALRSPTRKGKIELVIMVREPRIYKYTDKDIVQGSLYISQKVIGSSSFKIGTCETQELGVSLIEDRAKEINYGGALVIVKYSLCVGIDENGGEIWETVPKNTNFFVDGTKTKRKGNIVTLKAYDPASLLDIELPKNQITYGSLYEQAKWIWEYAATHIAPANSDSNTSVHIAYEFMSEEDFNTLPNTDISADFSSGQIVSCRDALMWIAQLMCSYVMFKANENGDINILTFKRHRYDGNMKNEREITAQERQNIEFTDTRTYCTYLLAYSGDEQKIYTGKVNYNESWDPQYINTGGISLPKNPLVSQTTLEQQDTINQGAKTYDGGKLASFVYSTKYTVMEFVRDRAVISYGEKVVAAMNVRDLTLA